MKKILVAVLLGAALSLTACGGESKDYGAKADTLTTQSETNVDQQYLDNVAESMTPDLYNESQSDVLALGYTICEKSSEGFTPEQITEVGLNSQLNPHDFGAIVGSAVKYLCPEHSDEWVEFFDGVGGYNS